MQKNSLQQSILATKTLESAIDRDLFSIMKRYGSDDGEAASMLQHVQSMVEITMGSLRAKLQKLEIDLNTLNDKREEKK